MIFPVSGLFQAGGHAYADRFTYLPLIGIYMAIAWSSADLFSKWPFGKLAVKVAIPTLLLAWITATWIQLPTWRDSRTLYEHALSKTRENSLIHYNLGNDLRALGHREEAVAHYQHALRIKPDYAEAHNNSGAALLALGRFKESATHYQAALRIRPDYTYAHNNLAWLRATCPDATIRDGGQALAHAKRAVQLAGEENAGFLDSLSAAYAELGDFDEAVRWQRKAVHLASDEIRDDLAARLGLYKQGQPYRESHGSAP